MHFLGNCVLTIRSKCSIIKTIIVGVERITKKDVEGYAHKMFSG